MGYRTGEQFRAARAMVGWEQSELAERANVSVKTIKRMEASSGPVEAHSEWSVVRALEMAGIEFVGGYDRRDRNDGVRFAKDRTAMLRHKILEGMQFGVNYALKEKAEQDPDFFERSADDILKMVSGEIEKQLRESLSDILNRKDDRPA